MRLDNLGFWGTVLLALDIWALIHVFQSAATPAKKAVWTVLILLLPLLGFILWFLMGPRSGKG